MSKLKKITLLISVFLIALNIVACGQVKDDETVINQQESNMQTVENTDSEKNEDEIANVDESSINQQENNEQTVESEDSETKTVTNDTEENLSEVENNQECSILVIVDRYEDDMIVVRDSEDEDIIMYFLMKNAEVIEGDTPIAAGDIVELTYTGVQGDDVGEHPGTAVKIVAESMMYK
ncbi:MAG: hypothetical protein K2N34_02105 [Lachnospiraceae bacterium]|nr:hypothetical protein [Lachnospiraceae bacterium]